MKIEVTMSKENIEQIRNSIRGFGEIIIPDQPWDIDRQINIFDQGIEPADEKLISKFASKKVEAAALGKRKIVISIDDEFIGDAFKFTLKAMEIFKPAIKLFTGLKAMLKSMFDDVTKESKSFGDKWKNDSHFEVGAWYSDNKAIRGYTIKEIDDTTKSEKIRHKMVCGGKAAMAILEDAINGTNDCIVELHYTVIDNAATYEAAKAILRNADKKDFEEINGIKSSITLDNE